MSFDELFINDEEPEQQEEQEEPTTDKGVTFKVDFANGETITVETSFYIVALIKAQAQYMEDHPEFTMEDLTMLSVRYFNGKQWEYIIKDSRFRLGVH